MAWCTKAERGAEMVLLLVGTKAEREPIPIPIPNNKSKSVSVVWFGLVRREILSVDS
jgi:hypothetical protein